MKISRRADRKIEAYQQELIKTHFAEVDNMYRKMRGWRHDYRNHIQAMKALAVNNDMSGIKAYLEELDTDLSTVDTVVKTGNPMADAILNSKLSLMREYHIRTEVTAHVPTQMRITDTELCVLLGNLLDNAIEACRKGSSGGKPFYQNLYGYFAAAVLHFRYEQHGGKGPKARRDAKEH